MARATPREVRLAAAQLAVCGLGGRMCWYALNVAIDVFSDAFGYSIYPEMLFVYNVSATVGLVLQVLFDAQCDAQYGIRRTFACRYMAGVLWLVGLQLIFPLVARLDPEDGRVLLLALVGACGICDYYAAGALTQIAGLYGGSPAVVFIGQSACGILLLIYTQLTGYGGDSNTGADDDPARRLQAAAGASGPAEPDGTWQYFLLCSGLSLLGALVFVRFWARDPCAAAFLSTAEANRAPRGSGSMVKLEVLKDMLEHFEGAARRSDAEEGSSSVAQLEATRAELRTERQRFLDAEKAASETAAQEAALVRRALRESWALQLAIAVLWVALLGVQSYFTLIRCQMPDPGTAEPAADTGGGGHRMLEEEPAGGQPASDGSLNQMLVYVNLFSLAAGQWLPDWLPGICRVTPARLLAASTSMLGALPLATLYVRGHIPPAPKHVICVVIGAFYVLGSALWMLCYRAVPSTVAQELQPATIRLLNLSLALGILVGISGVYVVEHACPAGNRWACIG